MSASTGNSPVSAAPSAAKIASSEDSLHITIQPTSNNYNNDSTPPLDGGQRSPHVLSKSPSQTIPIIVGNDGTAVSVRPSSFATSSSIGGSRSAANQVASKQSMGVPPSSAIALEQSLQVPLNPNDLKARSLMELPQVIRETGMLKPYTNYTAMGTARNRRLDEQRGLRKRVHLYKEHAIQGCYARVQERFKRIRRDLRLYAIDRVEIAQIRHLLKMVFERNYAECDLLLLQGTKNLIQLQEPTSGNTVLHIAAILNDVTMMTFLLRKGAVPNSRNRRGLTPAMIAAQHGFSDMIELLAMAQADFNVKDNAGRNVLFFCLQPTARHKKCLQRCVDFDADVNCCDAGGAPLVYEACEIADIIPDICVELIDSGASTGVGGAQRTTQRTPLNAACRAGCVRVVKTLLENGANPNGGDEHSVMPVHEAAYVGSLPCLQLLSAYGANFSAQAEDGNTPLHIAAFEGHTTVCRFLVSRGCDAALKNVERFAPQQIAKFFNQKPTIKEMKKGAKVVKALRANNQMWKVRFYDWVSSNEPALQLALKNIAAAKNPPPPPAPASPTIKPTTKTASSPPVTKLDVEDFCQVLQNLRVPLLTEDQQKEICTALTEPGSTPPKIDLVQFFKAVKYMPKQAQLAAFFPKVKKVKLAKAQPNNVSQMLKVCANDQPNYPIALKYQGGPIVPVVKRMVDFTRFTRDTLPELLRDDVFWYIDVPPTPFVHLTEAARFGDMETLAEAVENKIELDQVDKYFRSPLITAAAGGLLQTVMFLVKHGAHVDWPRDGFKWTALHHACRAGHLEIVQYLVTQGADIKCETINNCTPLMKAIEGGRYECVEYLLSLGTPEAVNHTNRAGLNATRYAETFGNLAILELVEKFALRAAEIEMAKDAKNNKKGGARSSGAPRSSGGAKGGKGGDTGGGSGVNQQKADKAAAQRVAPDAAIFSAATAAARVSSSQVGVPLKSIATRDILTMQPTEFGAADDDVETLVNSQHQKFPLRDPFHTSNPDEASKIVDENETLVLQAATLLEKDLERNGDTTFYTVQGVVKPHLKGTEELVQDRAHKRVLDGMHVDFAENNKTYVKNLHEKIDQNLPLIQQAGLSVPKR